MSRTAPFRLGYVVKRYPRFSETFIVREILAHEAAGLEIDIFSLRPSNDAHFQDLISRVKAPVHPVYLRSEGLMPELLAGATLGASHFWRALGEASATLPNVWDSLGGMVDEEARNVYQSLALACAVKRLGITHLHASFASEPTTIARMAARLAGITYSFTARAKDIFHDSVRPDDLRKKLEDASGVVTISDYHLGYLRETYGWLADRVIRVYNGLDHEEFSYSEPRDRPPVILAVGRLVEKKGFFDLIHACALLSRRGCEFRCRIIGSGALGPDLQDRIVELGLSDRVELVGPRPQGEVIQEMRGASVLAMPCIVGDDGDRDGLPNVIQEALALGTPVISTDVTGIPEVVRDGETGIQVPQKQPAALADALERLLVDPELRVRLARGGRDLIEAEFDIRRNTARRRSLFRGELRPAGQALVGAH